MKFTTGGSLADFEEYHPTARGKLGRVEKSHILSNPDHLILFEHENKIAGHAIWHESNTE